MTNMQQAMGLRKSQNYQQAVDIYAPLWQESPAQFDDWAGWSYAFCLAKLNRHKEALEVCRKLYPRYPHSEILNSLYGQCIYHTEFARKDPPSVATLRKALTAMFQLSPPYHPYSFTPKATFKLVKTLLNQQPIHWQEIESWLLKLDPDLLDDRTFKWTDQKGRTMELASPKEEWYSHMIKVKGGLNQPQELLDILDTARKQNLRWHYNNDLWFARKEAFALHALGQKEKAENILRKIITRKPDWFLLYDLSQMIHSKEEIQQLLYRAALAPGKNEMKLKVFQSLYQELKLSDPRVAGLHLCLIVAIRKENEWAIEQAMTEKILALGINPQNESSSLVITRKLISFWKQQLEKHAERLSGIVEMIFPHQKSGFIRSGEDQYYFISGKLEGRLHKGTKVSFEIKDRFDKKKNKPGKMAVHIQLISK
ncbi:MAG: tetratricopeptide repeat protein [Chitinophagaceae bacterium]|nr:tetratricopeptide repeat protein [Chitinophagaceae bacterium]